MISKSGKPVFGQDHAQKTSDTPVTSKGNAMSETYVLKADLRTRVGKGSSRELRRNGQIPAVIYGDKQEPLAIAVSYKEIFYKIHGVVLRPRLPRSK
jgi:hypothetical protein